MQLTYARVCKFYNKYYILLDGKYDGSQNLNLTNYTHCIVHNAIDTISIMIAA